MFVNNFKIARIKAGYTQMELAEKLDTDYVQLCRYESGKGYPRIDRLIKMADILNVSVDYLLGRVND